MWPFTALFGNPKTTEKVVSTAMKGLDAIVFTDEERAQANAEFREWYLRYLEATQPQNLARRLISLIVTMLFSILVLACVLVWPMSPAYAEYIFKLATKVVVTPFGIIIGFYFTAHVMRALPIGKQK